MHANKLMIGLENSLDRSFKAKSKIKTKTDKYRLRPIPRSLGLHLWNLYLHIIYLPDAVQMKTWWFAYYRDATIVNVFIAHLTDSCHHCVYVISIGGGASEARRLVPLQILGTGGTLWSVPPRNFWRQMLLDTK